MGGLEEQRKVEAEKLPDDIKLNIQRARMLRKARLEQKLEEERRLEEIESQKQRDERLIAAMPNHLREHIQRAKSRKVVTLNPDSNKSEGTVHEDNNQIIQKEIKKESDVPLVTEEDFERRVLELRSQTVVEKKEVSAPEIWNSLRRVPSRIQSVGTSSTLSNPQSPPSSSNLYLYHRKPQETQLNQELNQNENILEIAPQKIESIGNENENEQKTSLTEEDFEKKVEELKAQTVIEKKELSGPEIWNSLRKPLKRYHSVGFRNIPSSSQAPQSYFYERTPKIQENQENNDNERDDATNLENNNERNINENLQDDQKQPQLQENNIVTEEDVEKRIEELRAQTVIKEKELSGPEIWNSLRKPLKRYHSVGVNHFVPTPESSNRQEPIQPFLYRRSKVNSTVEVVQKKNEEIDTKEVGRELEEENIQQSQETNETQEIIKDNIEIQQNNEQEIKDFKESEGDKNEKGENEVHEKMEEIKEVEENKIQENKENEEIEQKKDQKIEGNKEIEEVSKMEENNEIDKIQDIQNVQEIQEKEKINETENSKIIPEIRIETTKEKELSEPEIWDSLRKRRPSTKRSYSLGFNQSMIVSSEINQNYMYQQPTTNNVEKSTFEEIKEDNELQESSQQDQTEKDKEVKESSQVIIEGDVGTWTKKAKEKNYQSERDIEKKVKELRAQTVPEKKELSGPEIWNSLRKPLKRYHSESFSTSSSESLSSSEASSRVSSKATSPIFAEQDFERKVQEMAIKKDSPSPKNQDFSGVWKSMKKERSTPRASSRHLSNPGMISLFSHSNESLYKRPTEETIDESMLKKSYSVMDISKIENENEKIEEEPIEVPKLPKVIRSRSRSRNFSDVSGLRPSKRDLNFDFNTEI